MNKNFHLRTFSSLLASFLLTFSAFAQVDTDFSGGGAVRVGDSTSTCDGTTEGAIRFDADGADTLDYCDGSNWLSLLTSTIGGAVVNNGNSYTAAMIIGTNDNNTLSFETNGNTRITIDTSGNVGVGTSTPDNRLELYTNSASLSDLLKITNVSASDSRGGAILFESGTVDSGRIGSTRGPNSASGDLHFYGRQSSTLTEMMTVIGASGNVGIGTTSPAVALDVHTGSINAAQICDENNANCLDLSAGVGGGGDFLANGSVPMTGTLKATNGSAAAPSITFNGDQDTGIYWHSADRLGFTVGGSLSFSIYSNGMRFDDGGWIDNGRFQVDGSEALPGHTFEGDTDTGMYSTTPNTIGFSTGGSERARIDSSGNVGIGTTAPEVGLHVSENNSATPTESSVIIRNIASGLTAQSRLSLERGSDSGTGVARGSVYFVTSNSTGIADYEARDIKFYTNPAAGSGTERLTIKPDGDIGIGTDLPDVELDVHTGTINAAQICDENNANCLDLSAGVGSGVSALDAADGSPTDVVSVDNDAVIVLGEGDGGSPSNVRVRGPIVSGSNLTGVDLAIEAPNGTGTGGSGSLVFKTAGTASVNVTQENVSSASQTSPFASSTSWSHTVGTNSDRLLLVGVASGGTTVSSITFGAQSFSSAGTANLGGVRVSIYYLVNPASGTGTVTVTNSGNGRFMAGSISYYNVDQTTPVSAIQTDSDGSGNNVSVSHTSHTSQRIFDVVGQQSGNGITAQSGQTEETERDVTDIRGLIGTLPGSASITSQYSFSSPWNCVMISVAIFPPGGGGATNPSPMSERMRINESGYVGIGNNAPDTLLHMTGGSGGSHVAKFQRVDGNNSEVLINMAGQKPTVGFNPNGGGTAWALGVNTNDFRIHYGDSNINSGTTALTIDNSGNVGIGTSSPSHILHITGQGRSTASAWATTSDARLKNVVGDYPYSLAEIDRINTYLFRYKRDNPYSLPSDQDFMGTMAQELMQIMPEAVSEDANGYYTVNTDPIFWALVNATKELSNKCLATDDEIAQLKEENKKLKAELQAIRELLQKHGIE